jgi:hypothetical protein
VSLKMLGLGAIVQSGPAQLVTVDLLMVLLLLSEQIGDETNSHELPKIFRDATQ